MDWYIFALIAMAFYGLQKFLFKISAEMKLHSRNVTLFFMISVTVLALIVHIMFFPNQVLLSWPLLCAAAINGLLFTFLSLSRFKGLNLAPALVVMPIFELSFLILIPFSYVYFGERYTSTQLIAIAFGIVAGYILSRKHESEHKKYPYFMLGVLAAIAAAVFSGLSTIVAKLAAVSQFSVISFIAVSYGCNIIYLLIFDLIEAHRASTLSILTRKLNQKEVVVGIGIGLANFGAFYAMLESFKTGSAVIVGTITGFSSVIALLLSVVLYREKLTRSRIIAFILSFLAVFLAR